MFGVSYRPISGLIMSGMPLIVPELLDLSLTFADDIKFSCNLFFNRQNFFCNEIKNDNIFNINYKHYI